MCFADQPRIDFISILSLLDLYVQQRSVKKSEVISLWIIEVGWWLHYYRSLTNPLLV